MSSAVYGALSVVDLKDLLREKGLPVSGKKAELIDRLMVDEGVLDKPVVEAPDGLLIPYEVEAEARDRVVGIVKQAEAIVILNDEEHRLAGEFLTTKVKRALKALDDAFDPIIRSWHMGHKQTLATKKKLAEPLLEVERNLKSAISDYHETQRVLQEQERKELERQMRDDAETEIVRQAAELFESGDIEAGTALLDSLSSEGEVPSLPAKFVRPEADGIKVRRVMKWRFISRDEMKREYMMPDHVKINAIVREKGYDAAEEVGGIEVYEENQVAAGVR